MKLGWATSFLFGICCFGCATGSDDDAKGRADACAGGACVDGASDDTNPSGDDTDPLGDSAGGKDTAAGDTSAGDDTGTTTTDTGTFVDTGVVVTDTGTKTDTSTGGAITGGPCLSGAKGATAFRMKWINGGGKALSSLEVNGLPDKSRWKVGAYGYSIGFTPSFVDPFLGEGGLQLDSSDFVDVEISTSGLASISSATLAIYGRSYNTTTSGSFNWMTFTASGAAPTDLVSNVAPYKWYGANATVSFKPGDAGVLLRIKAGPSSNALVVNRIELCMEAS